MCAYLCVYLSLLVQVSFLVHIVLQFLYFHKNLCTIPLSLKLICISNKMLYMSILNDPQSYPLVHSLLFYFLHLCFVPFSHYKHFQRISRPFVQMTTTTEFQRLFSLFTIVLLGYTYTVLYL